MRKHTERSLQCGRERFATVQWQPRAVHSLRCLVHPKHGGRSTLNPRVQDKGLAAKAGNSVWN
jgi:hypothetical protein